MQQQWIFYPVLGMALLTLLVGLQMLACRIKAVKEDGLNPGYFKLNRGAKLPDYLIRVTQHYENLFELPILFYVVILFVFFMQKVDYFYLALAWLYFASRLAHAYVHIGSNKLIHRRNVFLTSTILLYALWGKLLFDLLAA